MQLTTDNANIKIV